jgi:hypothetical protein
MWPLIAISVRRFFKQLLLVFLIQQMAGGLFRAIAGLCRSMIIAQTGGALFLLIFFVLGGFLLPKGQLLILLIFPSHPFPQMQLS